MIWCIDQTPTFGDSYMLLSTLRNFDCGVFHSVQFLYTSKTSNDHFVSAAR